MRKEFQLAQEQIRSLAEGHGGCIATDKITVEGFPVGFMYRESPSNALDSGWRFLSGHEDDEYMSAAGNHGVYDVNTIANYDPSIIPFLGASIGCAFEKEEASGQFLQVEE